MKKNKTIKTFLLSLTLLASVSPVFGMEWLNKENIKSGKEEVKEAIKPFGKLIDPKAAEIITNLKEIIANHEGINATLPALPPELFERVVFDCLMNQEIDAQIRANVALEFLADPHYEFLHSEIVKLIETTDLFECIFPLLSELNYHENMVTKLRPALSKRLCKTIKAFYTSSPNYSDQETKQFNVLIKYLSETDLSLLSAEDLHNAYDRNKILTDRDLLDVLQHTLSLELKNMTKTKLWTFLQNVSEFMQEAVYRNLNFNVKVENAPSVKDWILSLYDTQLEAINAGLYVQIFSNLLRASSFNEIYHVNEK